MHTRQLAESDAGHSRRPRAGRTRRVAALAVAVAALVPLAAVTGAPSGSPEAAAADSGVTIEKTLTRQHILADGTEGEEASQDVTVTVDQTADLIGRQRIEVSWRGAEPTTLALNAAEIPAERWAAEYPVLLAQCRGHDTPEDPLRPEDCLTSAPEGRSMTFYGGDPEDFLLPWAGAPWTLDRYADPADRTLDRPTPRPEYCSDVVYGDGDYQVDVSVPFVDIAGRAWYYCTLVGDDGMPAGQDIPPDVGVAGALPPNDQFGFTTANGDGRALFEVRTAQENASLGCSDAVPCSLVVVPIFGVSCDLRLETTNWQRERCQAEGGFDVLTEPEPSVSGQTWWTESNWRNRIAVPLDFAPPADVCDVLDTRAPVNFYGSELLSQATRQWAPAFCLDDDRFKFRHQRAGEPRARGLVDSGGAVAAFGSRPADGDPTRPTVYAPAAVTGFAIGYYWRHPRGPENELDPVVEVTDLRLTPRLLAKLVTQSYRDRNGSGHPDIGANPRSIGEDPEFQALNPDAGLTPSVHVSALTAISTDSDVVWELTRYIDADPAARAWLDGAQDENGMVVNPKFRGIELPIETLPLLDEWVIPPGTVPGACEENHETLWLNLVASPLATLAETATSVLEGQPSAQTACELPGTGTDPSAARWDRVGRDREVLALVSLADAERFRLRTAALQTQPDAFVAPNPGTMRTALRLAPTDEDTGTTAVDQQAIRTHELGASAYPGTMLVYTTATTSGLAEQDAARVADFMRFSVTDGQVAGDGNGQLPAGYLPITRESGLGSLIDRTLELADAVQNQTGEEPPPKDDLGPDDPVDGGSSGAPPGGDAGGDPNPPPGSTVIPPPGGNDGPGAGNDPSDTTDPAAGADDPAQDGPAAAEEALTSAAATRGDTSWLARWALPLLLLLGLAGGVIAPVVVAAKRPGHPVRVALIRLGTRLRGLVPSRGA